MIGSEKKSFGTRYRIELLPNFQVPQGMQMTNKREKSYTITLPFTDNINISAKIAHLISLKHNNLASILQVVESYRNQSYTLIYQTYPYQPLPSSSLNKKKQTRKQIENIVSFLLTNNIRPKIQANLFSFDYKLNLKFYLFPDFTVFHYFTEEEVQQALLDCLKECDKIFTSSSPNGQFNCGRFERENNVIKRQLESGGFNCRESHRYSLKNSSNISDITSRMSQQNKFYEKCRFLTDSHNSRHLKTQQEKTKSSSTEAKGLRQKNLQLKVGGKKTNSIESCSEHKSSIAALKQRVTQVLNKTKHTINKYNEIKSKK